MIPHTSYSSVESSMHGTGTRKFMDARFIAVGRFFGRLLGSLRRYGSQYPLTLCSLVANGLLGFALLFLLASADPAHGGDTILVDPSATQLGPLRLGILTVAAEHNGMLPDSIGVLMGDCLVASFDFEDDFSKLMESQLYDLPCRPCISPEVDSGATIYTKYKTGSDAHYSVGDDDGDGVADKKINWITKRSYERSKPLQWTEMTKKGPQ